MMVNFICNYCGKTSKRRDAYLKVAAKKGAPVFCDKKCAGLGRRTNETPEEKKAIKYWYDQFLNVSMTEDEKELEELQRMVYFQWEYARNPEKHRKRRQERMAAHVEYCRQPEYKVYKQIYDEQYRAKKDYGEYWEAAIVLKNLESIIPHRLADKENKLHNKSITKKKRLWQKMLKQTSNLQPKI